MAVDDVLVELVLLDGPQKAVCFTISPSGRTAILARIETNLRARERP
jgi:hypothetical protein